MIHIIAQPKIEYYTWQVEVVINSILTQMPDNTIQIICASYKDTPTNRWKILELTYPTVQFFYYEDTRMNPRYISSIRPHIIEKHFKLFPNLASEVIFYHDSDIVFNKPLNLEHYYNGDDWYLSDTISYIGYEYIQSKGDDVLELMCDIVDISPEVIKNNQMNSGGAQYIMKNVDHIYWNDVYMDCENLYTEITKLNNQKKTIDPEYHELQIWCADMWAVLWNAWKRNYNTICDKSLDFNWTTTDIHAWDSLSIYHNAGVTSASEGMFFKNNYVHTLPYNTNLENLNEKVCVYNYYKYVQQVGTNGFLHNTISIVIICTNNYSILGLRLINNFMKHYTGNKKIIFNIFTDVDLLDYLPAYNTNKYLIDVNHFKNDNWCDGTNSKFINILSLQAYGEYIYYVDADTNIDRDFDETWFLGDIVGGEHFNNRQSDQKNYDRNPQSKAYIPIDTQHDQTYYYGAFFGGLASNVMEMCKTLYSNQISDKLIGYEPAVNDESYINNYFHYNKPSIVMDEDFCFLISDKGGIDDIRVNSNISVYLDIIKENKDCWYIKNGKVHI
jgi:hypothetical protein